MFIAPSDTIIMTENEKAKQLANGQEVPTGGYSKGTQTFNFADQLDLEPFAGTPYESQAKALANQNYSYSMGPFESWAKNMNWRTSYDKYYEDTQQDVLQKYNDLLGKLGDIKQNSPASKSAQMASAGLNPDLLGTEGVSDAPGLPSDAVQAESPSQNTFQSAVPEVFNKLAQVMTSGISLYQGLQGIQASKTAIDSANIDLFSKAKDYAVAYGLSLIKPNSSYEDFKKALAGDTFGSSLDFSHPDTLRHFNDFLGFKLSRRNAKGFFEQVKRYLNSEDFYTRYLKGRGERASAVSNTAEQSAKAGIDVNTSAEVTETMKSWKPIYDIFFKWLKGDYTAKTSENRFKTEYFGAMNGISHASLDTSAKLIGNRNATLEGGLLGLDFKSKKFENDLREGIYTVAENLRHRANNGDMVAEGELIALLGGQFVMNTFGNAIGSGLGGFSSGLGTGLAKGASKKLIPKLFGK